MFYALQDGRHIEATKGARGVCPLCGKPLRAKCGEVVEWHWAHEFDGDCDPWAENETPWHRWWKERARSAWREVTIGAHRADICREDRSVIELQHSSITPAEIREREQFYGKLIWLLDARLYPRGSSLFGGHVDRLEVVGPGRWQWRWPRRSFIAAQKRVFLDLGENVLEITRVEGNLGPEGRKRKDTPCSSCGAIDCLHGEPGPVFVNGRRRTREQFLRVLGLETVVGPDVVSYIAEWERERRVRDFLGIEKLVRYVTRREFRHLDALERWARRRRPKELGVLAWHANGALRVVPRERTLNGNEAHRHPNV